MSRTVTLPGQLVLGDFEEAAAAVRAAEGGSEEGPPLLDGSAVRRVDGAGLQWLLVCLRGAEPAARLESNAVLDEAFRISGAGALLPPRP